MVLQKFNPIQSLVLNRVKICFGSSRSLSVDVTGLTVTFISIHS